MGTKQKRIRQHQIHTRLRLLLSRVRDQSNDWYIREILQYLYKSPVYKMAQKTTMCNL